LLLNNFWKIKYKNNIKGVSITTLKETSLNSKTDQIQTIQKIQKSLRITLNKQAS